METALTDNVTKTSRILIKGEARIVSLARGGKPPNKRCYRQGYSDIVKQPRCGCQGSLSAKKNKHSFFEGRTNRAKNKQNKQEEPYQWVHWSILIVSSTQRKKQ